MVDEEQDRRCVERSDIDGFQIGIQDHVGFVDGLPAFDGRTVEHEAIGDFVLTDDTGHHGEVLPFALGIGKAQVDPLDLFFFDHFQNVIRRIRHLAYPSMFQICCRRMHALPAFGVIPCARGTQIASESLSPVRIRRTVSTGTTKILPSPMRPVCAADAIASTTRSARLSSTTTSSFTFGTTRSEEHTSELQSLMRISYAVFC